jgi:hypothetical protein
MENPSENVVVLVDPVEFKRTSNLFPLPKLVDISSMTMKEVLNDCGANNDDS